MINSPKMPDDLQTALLICAREPIHIPGSIQAHGFLLTMDMETNKVVQASGNVNIFLDMETSEIIGKELHELPLAGLKEVLAICNTGESFERLNPFKTKILSGNRQHTHLNLIGHESNGLLLLEFEAAASPEQLEKNGNILSTVFSLISAPGKMDQTLQKIAEHVKTLIDFDKVMIYRFAEDWHGEVIAEVKNDDDTQEFLGLHFPASDIPEQARALYVKNVVRIIADVQATVSPLEPVLVAGQPVDLGKSVLRAVSPVHIQYLKNMGIGASFSISIIIDKKLWGLISCHNYSAKFIPFELRQTGKLVSQLLSAYIKNAQDEQEVFYKNMILENERLIIESVREHWNLPLGLCKKQMNLTSLNDSTGAAFFFNDEMHLVGETPSASEISEIIKWLGTYHDKNFFFQSSNFPGVYPLALDFADKASGIMSICVSQYLNEYIIWFLPEVKKTLKWAGSPIKKGELNEAGNLTPRKSFAAWQEDVKNTSASWKNSDILVALKLKEDIKEIISFKSNEIRKLNEKLLQANTELDAFSYTVSHDLKNPLTTINAYSQILTELYKEKLDENALSYLNRISASARKLNEMIDDILNYTKSTRQQTIKKSIEIKLILNEIVEDITANRGVVAPHFIIRRTPAIFGDKTMIKQIFQNIITNAVKYSSGPGKNAEVEIDGEVQDEQVVYSIRDNGIGIDMKYASKIFEIFTRLHTGQFEGHGVGLSIVKRLIERHDGKIWLESNDGHGTIFYLAFPKV